MELTFEKIRTTINSLSIGREYMLRVIDLYVSEGKGKLYNELDDWIRNIESKVNVDSFYFHPDLRRIFMDETTYDKVSDRLNRYLCADEDFWFYFMYHARNVLKKLDKLTNGLNKPKSKIHNFFKLLPKKPINYENISDKVTTYNTIMSKVYLTEYNNYIDPKDNGAGAWTFQLEATYLIIIDRLYRLLKPYKPDVEEFFFDCMVNINPILVGFTYSTVISINVLSIEVMYELMQLTPSGSYLSISKNPDNSEIQFTFTTNGGTFTNSEQVAGTQIYRHDNNGKRNIQLNIRGSGQELLLKVDIVGLQSIQDITGMACNPFLASFNTFDNYLEAVTYKILGTMLSHTAEFKADAKRYGDNLLDNVFMALEHEKLMRPLILLEQHFPRKRYKIDCYRYVLSGLNMTDREISEMLKPLGSKQQAEIRKMITFVKSMKFEGIPALNQLYKKVTYRI